MAKRTVKSLHRTGRVSRDKARSVARSLRLELKTGEIKQISGKKIARKTTASGRSAIAFHVVKPKKSAGPARPVRTAARKASR